MMSPQYIPVGPVCCWGSSLVEKVSGVVLEELEVMVGIELVVEAEWREECCIGASTLVEVHSTKFAAGNESETSEKEVEFGMEMDKTTKEVQTRKDEQGDPKKAYEQVGWGGNKLGMTLAFPADKVWVHEASFD